MVCSVVAVLLLCIEVVSSTYCTFIVTSSLNLYCIRDFSSEQKQNVSRNFYSFLNSEDPLTFCSSSS